MSWALVYTHSTICFIFHQLCAGPAFEIAPHAAAFFQISAPMKSLGEFTIIASQTRDLNSLINFQIGRFIYHSVDTAFPFSTMAPNFISSALIYIYSVASASFHLLCLGPNLEAAPLAFPQIFLSIKYLKTPDIARVQLGDLNILFNIQIRDFFWHPRVSLETRECYYTELKYYDAYLKCGSNIRYYQSVYFDPAFINPIDFAGNCHSEFKCTDKIDTSEDGWEDYIPLSYFTHFTDEMVKETKSGLISRYLFGNL